MAEAPKVKKENLARVAIILATFLIAVPTTFTARAIPVGNLSLSPALNTAEDGEFFLADVVFSTPSASEQITGFDIKIEYDPNILQIIVTGTELSFTAFDLNQNGDLGDDPVLVAHADVFNTIGLARFTAVLLGGASVQPGSMPGKAATLVHLTFAAYFGPMATATDLPSPIGLNGAVVGFDEGGKTILVPMTITGGTYEPLVTGALRSVGCRAAIPGFSIQDHGTMADVFCRVFNPTSVAGIVQANFAYLGLVLPPDVVSSDPMLLEPGQAAELHATIDLSASGPTDVVIVTGQVVRTLLMPDGTTATTPGGSQTFKIVVND